MPESISAQIDARDKMIIEQFGSFEAFNIFRNAYPNIDPFTGESIIECPRGHACYDNDSSYHWNYSAWK